jgi:hypothetical protein
MAARRSDPSLRLMAIIRKNARNMRELAEITADEFRRLAESQGGVIKTIPEDLITSVEQLETRAKILSTQCRLNLVVLANPKGLPPPRAEKVLSFLLPPDKLEEVIGDFEDGYRLLFERHGRGHAQGWYCWQVFMVAIGGIINAAYRAAKIWAR